MTKEFGIEQKFGGADSNIFRENYFSPEFVVENTVLDYPKGEDPEAIVAIGPGRTGSTAFIGLMISQPEIQLGYYQPWKTLIRHGEEYGKFLIPGKSNGTNKIFLKDTLGPFNNDAEEFDPIELLEKAGFDIQKIKPLVLLRNPLGTYKSNLKFDGGIEPDILVSNIKYTWSLYEKYKKQGLSPVPYAYDLTALGDSAIAALFDKLKLNFVDTSFDPQALKKIEDGGKYVPGESAHPAEWEEIVVSAFSHQRFEYVNGQTLEPSDFSRFIDMPGAKMSEDELVGKAKKIDMECSEIYKQFVTESINSLGLQVF